MLIYLYCGGTGFAHSQCSFLFFSLPRSISSQSDDDPDDPYQGRDEDVYQNLSFAKVIQDLTQHETSEKEVRYNHSTLQPLYRRRWRLDFSSIQDDYSVMQSQKAISAYSDIAFWQQKAKRQSLLT